MKITTRLTATLMMLVAVVVGVAGLALWQMRSMQASAHRITANWLPGIGLVSAMNTDAANFRLRELRHVLTTDPAERMAIEEEIAALKASLENKNAAYVELIGRDEERDLHERFAADWKAYLVTHEQLLAHSRNNDADLARVVLGKESRQLHERFTATLQKLVDLNVEGGADEAGKTMGDIVGSIRRVNDFVADISTASQEQSLALSQVSDAVGQMDQATQQNAALVEQCAAAAESLKVQAQQLVQTVAVFAIANAPAQRRARIPAQATKATSC